MSIDEPIRGQVAKILNSRELVVNRGSSHGVEKGLIFAVLDPSLEKIEDPETGELLGSLERPKAYVKVGSVEEKFCIARTFRFKLVGSAGGFTGIASLFEPRRKVYDTFDTHEQTWDELDEEDSYVKTGDPVKEIEYAEEE